MGLKIIKWLTDNITHLAPHLTYPDIDKSFFLVLWHIAKVIKEPQKDFNPESIHMSSFYGLLCSVGAPEALRKDSIQVLLEENDGAGEREEGVPVVSCFEGDKIEE